MKKSNVIKLLGAFILSVTSLAAHAAAGRIDTAYIYQKYSLVRDGYKTMQDSQATVQRLVATAEQELTDLRAKGKTETEINTKQIEIQKVIDKSIEDLYKQKAEFDNRIRTNIDNALAQLAKEKKLDVIYDAAFVSSGGVDITDEFLAKLEKMK